MSTPPTDIDPPIDVLWGEAASPMTTDARIVGLRWDLLEWDLVLDLDCPVSEASNADYSRGWLVFRNISDVSLPLAENVRLPNGIWGAGPMSARIIAPKLIEYAFRVLAPVFGDDDRPAPGMAQTATIRAEIAVGLLTRAHAPTHGTGLAYETRQQLGSDVLLRRVASQVATNLAGGPPTALEQPSG